jgi:hypothetical protein
MANEGGSEFDTGHAAGQKRAKKDARSEKDLWAIRQSLPTESDYDLGFSVGYERVTKDVMGPRGGVSVGGYGWLSGQTNYITFTPRDRGHSSGFRGPHAVEQMRYHLRNVQNIPTRDIDAALNGFRPAGGKRRHATSTRTKWVKGGGNSWIATLPDDYTVYLMRLNGHYILDMHQGPMGEFDLGTNFAEAKTLAETHIGAYLDTPYAGGKRRHAAPSLAAEAKALRKALRK